MALCMLIVGNRPCVFPGAAAAREREGSGSDGDDDDDAQTPRGSSDKLNRRETSRRCGLVFQGPGSARAFVYITLETEGRNVIRCGGSKLRIGFY